MRRIALALTLALTATSALAHGRNINIRNSAEDCSPRNVRFGDDDSFMKKEVIEPGNIRSLKVSVKNAPVSVEGGAASYSIVVCKAAEVASDLDLIRVRLDGNELVATGPDHDRWAVLYHLNVPRGADLDLSAKNGPLSISNVEGNVVARSHNGPLSLRDIDGTVDAETQNGPVSISGGSGTMKVTASNGPLSVDLDGRSWNGTLDASTKNGPLSVKVPNGYGSGVLVESRGRGPIQCRADGCERFWRNHDSGNDWDEPRRIELGSGPVNVRLSTVNGPVTVKGE